MYIIIPSSINDGNCNHFFSLSILNYFFHFFNKMDYRLFLVLFLIYHLIYNYIEYKNKSVENLARLVTIGIL